ncbi:MAG: Branched-chain-amino-acid aminotransferase [Candidatus Omnitrophica bacterium ADurb.Bin314]|nr:MAG: Branched-chain-amino-acid aminotransferase [Candidatus Omnitrophica bacterium ADurb.Bin314]
MARRVKIFRSEMTPWEVFRNVCCRSPVCFFLDSPRYAPPDQVFLDGGNYLTETRTANLFLVKHRIQPRRLDRFNLAGLGGESPELLTPPKHLILNGVTRRFVIKYTFAFGLTVRETPLTRHDFFNADEAFLTNASWEILAVRALDGRRIGKKVPGPVTTELHRLFKRRVQASCPGK